MLLCSSALPWLALLPLLLPSSAAFLPSLRPPPPRRLVTADATLESFLSTLSAVGPARAIVMRPGPEAILEAVVDLSTTSVKATEMPSGKTLVTVANTDKSFELHLDAGRSAKATLGTSAKTGGPVCRILDVDGAALTTLVFAKELVSRGACQGWQIPTATSDLPDFERVKERTAHS